MNVTIKIEEPEPLEIRAEWETARKIVDWMAQAQGEVSPAKGGAALDSCGDSRGASIADRFNTLPGERIIDYIDRAYAKLQTKRFSLSQIMPLMESEGWKSKSTNPAPVVRSTLRNAKKKYFSHGDGTWERVGNERKPSKKAEQGLSLDETNDPELTLNGA